MRKAKVAHKPLKMRSAKPIRTGTSRVSASMDLAFALMQDKEDHQPLPQIDRRHVARTRYETTAWLSPADDTGAIRRPIILTRDLNARGIGFRSRQDVSALSEAILRLPAAAADKWILVACRIRRSLELGDGWFDGLVEFLQPQPDLVLRQTVDASSRRAKTSDKSTRRR